MATDNAFNFTKTAINALELPDKKQGVTYRDTRTKGLTLMVFPSGSKTFYYVKRIAGKVEKVKVGRFPDLTVEQARNKVSEFNTIVGKGGNPQDTRRAFNKEITFRELHAWFIDAYAKHHKAESSVKEDIGLFNRHLADWGTRRISNITEHDVFTKHQTIGVQKGKYTANRTLELIRAMFNRAIDLGYWKGSNPARGTKKFKEKSRDRFLQADELQRFFEALNAEENTTARDYILLSLLTGQRKGNMLAMRWDELSLTRAEWRIPKTKNGDPLTVHLPPQAVELLRERKAASESDWVFPGAGKTGHLQDPKKAWQRILARAEIQDLRIHDLRRTLGSWQTVLGASSFIVGKSLGHKSLQSTAVYARLNLDPVRDSVNAATEAMFKAANGGK
ncbi:MAG: tyrosine-type recombinase/integrase [Hyphomicrobiales bacterium]|nr:tyrosine-type recombinase/integrase [Hyphomicrobiales bacterium]